jgi:hypothetical protein
MHRPSGLSPPLPPNRRVPFPTRLHAPITTSIDLLTNRLREGSQFNFQATQTAIKADPMPIETARVSGRRGSNPQLQPWEGCTLPLSYSRDEASEDSASDAGRRDVDCPELS